MWASPCRLVILMTNESPTIRRVCLLTLGCKLNQAESEAIARDLLAAGCQVVDRPAAADAFVINTCSVTHVADRKARHLARLARRLSPVAPVIVTGCYVETAGPGLAAAIGADLILKNDEKPSLAARLAGPGVRQTGGVAESASCSDSWGLLRTRAFLKVQEGCNDVCAFCVVPRTRGRERSVPLDEVVSAVRAREKEGVQEVVLTGTQLGAYRAAHGRERSNGAAASGPSALLRALLGETAAPRLRLSSLQPQDVTSELLSLWEDPRLCRHFHLVLQSGSDNVLARMRRRYTAADFRQALALIRRHVPDAAVTTDVMVGFPGESEADFEETLRPLRRGCLRRAARLPLLAPAGHRRRPSAFGGRPGAGAREAGAHAAPAGPGPRPAGRLRGALPGAGHARALGEDPAHQGRPALGRPDRQLHPRIHPQRRQPLEPHPARPTRRRHRLDAARRPDARAGRIRGRRLGRARLGVIGASGLLGRQGREFEEETMNVANRLIILLGALLLMFAVALVILFTWAAASESVQRLSDFVQFLHDHQDDNGSRIILTLGGVVVALLALVVVIAELTPPRAERVPVRDVRAGDALLSTDAIGQRLQQEVSAVPHVTQVKAMVAARGKGVEVDLELHVDPDTNLALTSEEACRAVENILTNRLSVEMARPPRLNLRYSELRLAAKPATTSPSPPPAPAEEPQAMTVEAAAADEEAPAAEEMPAEGEGESPQAGTGPDA